MAISLSGFAPGSDVGGDVDVTLTVASDDDYIVAMCGVHGGDGDDVTGVVIDPGGADEASFTQEIKKANTGRSDNPEAAIFYLLATDIPSAGDYTVRLQSGASAQYGLGVQAMSGAAQQAPEATAFTDTNGVGSITISGTTSGAVAFDVFATSSIETETDDEGQKLFAVEPGNATTIAGSWESSSGGDVTCGWSFTSAAPGTHVGASIAPASGGTTQNVTATLAGTSTDSVGSIILNLTGTTTLAGTSTTGGAITVDDLVALTATLAGTSTDTAAASLKEAITATLAGISSDGGAISTGNLVALAATLAGTSSDSGGMTIKELLAATLAGTSEDSGVIDLGPLVPGTYTTYDAVGIREDLQGKPRGRSMSKRALETAEQQLNDLLNNR